MTAQPSLNCGRSQAAPKGEIWWGSRAQLIPMKTHVKVLGTLHIVFGVVGVIIGVGVFVLFGGVAGLIDLDNDPDAAAAVPFLSLMGGIVLIIVLGLSLPGIIAGVGLLSYQPWARTVTIVVSLLELLNIPFGTALAVYGLWVLYRSGRTRGAGGV
jgi:hypothetical protein